MMARTSDSVIPRWIRMNRCCSCERQTSSTVVPATTKIRNRLVQRFMANIQFRSDSPEVRVRAQKQGGYLLLLPPNLLRTWAILDAAGHERFQNLWQFPVQLYSDPFFTFRFAEDRLIPRIHLEGVSAGQRVSIYSADPQTLQRGKPLCTGVVGEGGWVDVCPPLVVRAGEVFVVFPDA